MKFQTIARKSLESRYGEKGLAAFSPETVEQLLLAEAALLILAQAEEKFHPAQTLIRECMGWRKEEL